ncbi:MAG: Golgi Transport [Lichina confinis]|nr:MAG: Golgi Transport [Lichina confinis]
MADRQAELLMGNLLFLIGLPFTIGPQKTLVFFARRQKLRGTAAFAFGILLIQLGYSLIGFFVELYGIMVLFGEFLSTVAGFAANIPIVGPYIARALDWAGARRNEELPV